MFRQRDFSRRAFRAYSHPPRHGQIGQPASLVYEFAWNKVYKLEGAADESDRVARACQQISLHLTVQGERIMNRRYSIAVIASLVLFARSSRSQSSGPLISVFKTPTCSCCGKWVEHLRASGFKVKVQDVDSTAAYR